ncbi:hypothetical protein [Actinoplanes awajinensis]|uniref:SpoVT-AbrB domain-containing protein n=1 Tax=Actinoplanes awajinensis subsp. mycoplanecinus TaxID=135947 RepID=A0A117MKS8_9ACTN|nr:hypothetical protein [Actinoplanes awajinensis]KUL22837.1 hypothetical protein ADL15_47485 [Actinoplanes awajinensis subsp. mycoplanecinus]
MGYEIPREQPVSGVTVPVVALLPRVHPDHYAVTVVDGHGRMGAAASLQLLGWESGALIFFTVEDRLITAAAVAGSVVPTTAPRRVITARGHLNLPANIRRRAGIVGGDRLLLVADAQIGSLRIYSPKVLALVLQSDLVRRGLRA